VAKGRRRRRGDDTRGYAVKSADGLDFHTPYKKISKINEFILNSRGGITMKVRTSILDCIGNTPLVKLCRVTEGVGADVLVKPEFLNPSGSIKDRIALKMIEQAEKDGKLKPGYTIVEASSGNTAIAISLVGAAKGYRFKACFAEGLERIEKVKLMERYGTEVESIPPDLGKTSSMHGAALEVPGRTKCKMLEETGPNVWWARQYSNPSNVAAHRELGKEIFDQTDGKVDVFVASVGTGGTFLGVSSFLQEKIPHLKAVAVEPFDEGIGGKGFTLISGFRPENVIPGISGGIIETIVKSGMVDELFRITDEEAIEMAYRLSREEGLFCGMSSGANVFVALKEARRLGKGHTIVTVLPDSGDRYITKEVYTT